MKKDRQYDTAMADLTNIQCFAIDFAIESIKKLQNIEHIVSERSYTDEIGNAMYYTDEIRIKKIKEVLDE